MGAMDTQGTTGKTAKVSKGSAAAETSKNPVKSESALDRRIAAYTFVYQLGDGTLIKLTGRDAEQIAKASRDGINAIREDQRGIDKRERELADAARQARKAQTDALNAEIAALRAKIDLINGRNAATASPAAAVAAAVKQGNAAAANVKRVPNKATLTPAEASALMAKGKPAAVKAA